MVLENRGSAMEPRLTLVRDYDHEAPSSHDLGRDRPGRVHESTGSRRSSVEAPDLHQREEDRFLAGLAHDLEADASADAFEELAVVAAPVALGTLRRLIGAETAKRVRLWIDKDLTKQRIEQITETVAKALDG